jgi:hypothetical protein
MAELAGLSLRTLIIMSPGLLQVVRLAHRSISGRRPPRRAGYWSTGSGDEEIARSSIDDVGLPVDVALRLRALQRAVATSGNRRALQRAPPYG